MRAAFPEGDDLGIAAIVGGKCCDRSLELDSKYGERSDKLRAALASDDNIAASHLEAGRFVVVRNLHLNTPSETMEASGSSDCGPWRELESFNNLCCAVKRARLANASFTVFSLSVGRDSRSNPTSPCNTRASGVGR